MPPDPDPYPSRRGGEAQLLERHDPVVRRTLGAAAPGPLREAELVRFERQGFLFFERLFTRAEVERVGDEIPSGEGVHERHAELERMAADRRILGMAEQILGSRVSVYRSRIRRQPGFDGEEVPWHSDFERWHVEAGMPRMRAVSVAILLTASHPSHGPQMLIPGSHRHFVACSADGRPDREVVSWLVERGGIEAPTGPEGSVLLCDCNILHGASGNMTPYPRRDVLFVYNSTENTTSF